MATNASWFVFGSKLSVSYSEIDDDEALPAKAGGFIAPAPDPSVPAPERGGQGYLIVKRLFDIVFSLVVCAILIIPSIILCICIRVESPGNPLFFQERVGLRGKKFCIWKFRTMYADAHEHPERYLTPEQMKEWQREQKVENDPRITRIGRWLRRMSLDEVPQFINVLKGDLSVIGPRPVTESETHEFGNARDEFLSVKPGITGWWQVTDRNAATWQNGERQLLELFYVRHASFGLDLRVFCRTFKVMFIDRNGH